MTGRTTSRAGALAVAGAPLVLLTAFLWHPYLAGRLPNDAAVADAVAAGPTRWGWTHLGVGAASGALALAFIAVRSFLRDRGDDPWSAAGLPLIVLGSVLYAVLPGMEFAPLAAVETGADAEAAQAALEPWFVPVLLTGAVTFAAGVLSFAKGIAGLRVLTPAATRIVVPALVIFAASRFAPLLAVQGYVQAAAALVALWPLARLMWVRSAARVPGTAGASADLG